MDSIFLWLGAAGAALLLVAICVAWWEHLHRMAAIERHMAWSENSRLALEARAREVDARLLAMTAVLHNQQLAAPQSDSSTPKPTATAQAPRSRVAAAPELPQHSLQTTPRPRPSPPFDEAASAHLPFKAAPAAAATTTATANANASANASASATAAAAAISAAASANRSRSWDAERTPPLDIPDRLTGPVPTWADTEPMVLTTQAFDFAPTMPIDLAPLEPGRR